MIFSSFESIYASQLCESNKRVNPQNEFNLLGQHTALVRLVNAKPAHRLSASGQRQASTQP